MTDRLLLESGDTLILEEVGISRPFAYEADPKITVGRIASVFAGPVANTLFTPRRAFVLTLGRSGSELRSYVDSFREAIVHRTLDLDRYGDHPTIIELFTPTEFEAIETETDTATIQSLVWARLQLVGFDASQDSFLPVGNPLFVVLTASKIYTEEAVYRQITADNLLTPEVLS